SDFDEDWGSLGNYKTVYFFTLVALFILIIAWVNYINLSTARAVERAKEVGVRKVAGARKGQIVLQFLFESALTNGIALALAVSLAVLGLPYLNDLAGAEITMSIWQNPWFWGSFLGVFVVGMLLSSLYPAFVLSAFKPVTVLKGRQGTAFSKNWLRRVLVVFQFAASIALLIGTYAVYTQVNYMRGLDLGIDIERMLVTQRPSIVDEDIDFVETREVLKAELAALPAVDAVTTSTTVPGGGFSLGTIARKESAPESEREMVNVTWINYNFLETYGFDFAAGRNFSEELSTDQEEAIIINETAVRAMGFASIDAALGERIVVGGGDNTHVIVGVLKDFNWMSAKQEIDPIMFLPTHGGRYYTMKVQTANLDETLAGVRHVYDAVFPGNPFDYFFVDRFFDEQYKADRQFGTLFGIFALFAVFVACLGLVGLAAITAAQRTKEIGVRKVLGASAGSIVHLLLLDFGKLVLAALVLTLPLTYFALDTWLAGFASRIDLTLWLFLIPGLVVMALALLTVSYHTSRAALTNPADSLRYE
ncbi:MAG: FtsX-like permease family protein, partial [Bacteroidetes bacterium]|nr:FtsX-like permease family protein [Bacteroidota bacterium]